MRVCIVGRGKLGRALQRGLAQAGVDSVLTQGRSLRLPREARDVYLLAVPDMRIATVAAALGPQLPKRAVVLHLAGARAASELDSLHAYQVQVGVFHPLLSFAGATAGFAGATFTAFGDPAAMAAARRLGRRLSARVVVLEQAPGPAYHAAAALVANGAVALAQLGARALSAVGYEPRAAEHALASLLSSVADNIARLGLPAALTGPVARGDSSTVSAHLRALWQIDRELGAGYAAIQPAILQTALAQGLDPSRARQLRRALAPASLQAASRAAKRKAQVTK